MSELEKLTTKDRLPTREMIAEMHDISSMDALRDDVIAATKKIEVDLEFAVERDEDWAHRARGALAAHKVVIGLLTKRLKYLRGDTISQQEEQRLAAERKIAKAQAASDRLKAEAEVRDLKIEKERLKTKRMVVDHAKRQCWLSRFYIKAANNLSEEDFRRLCDLTEESLLTGAEDSVKVKDEA